MRNATQLSSHNPTNGRYWFHSVNVNTGIRTIIDMERVVELLEQLTGEKLMTKTYDASVIQNKVLTEEYTPDDDIKAEKIR